GCRRTRPFRDAPGLTRTPGPSPGQPKPPWGARRHAPHRRRRPSVTHTSSAPAKTTTPRAARSHPGGPGAGTLGPSGSPTEDDGWSVATGGVVPGVLTSGDPSSVTGVRAPGDVGTTPSPAP